MHSDYLLSNATADFGYYLAKDVYGDNRIVVGPWGLAWRERATIAR